MNTMTILAESPVLIGVINRKKDFIALRDQHWYRIPEGKAPKGLYAEVFAFFLSGSPFKEQSGGIHYYAYRRGMELVTRRDLFPDEADHPRADNRYHKIQLSPLQQKTPPILNRPRPYRFAFIYTTWDRFQSAIHIRDLYSQNDYFVDRIFHALRQGGIQPQRSWEAAYPSGGASLRILCEYGEVVAGTNPDDDDAEFIYLRADQYMSNPDAEIKHAIERIREQIKRHGGPRMVDIPVELY
jgi:hypothetical protein